MSERSVDILIIGGGPAGLAAATAAREAGAESILVVEREDAPGGILKQCIHTGFGLHTFNEELTGPEYAARYIRKAEDAGIEIRCEAMAVALTGDKLATVVSRRKGLELIRAKAVVLAMGCRERPRGALATPGTRCAGIYTAGTAQKLVNLKGLMPGRRVVILGSGDIGLIMARRMTFMGAKVLACVELMPYSAGLARNIVQCLEDFDIPLYLSHTVVDIEGEERLRAVTVAAVDDKLRPIPGTEEIIECDTLLLSVGLLPENELTAMAGVPVCAQTSGAEVDETLESEVPGIFSCGNVLHVHDLVDFVSEEAARAGRNAARYVKNMQDAKNAGADGAGKQRVRVEAGEGVGALVPQWMTETQNGDGVKLMFRPRGVYRDAKVIVERGGALLYSKKAKILVPGEMVSVELDRAKLASSAGDVKVRIEVE